MSGFSDTGMSLADVSHKRVHGHGWGIQIDGLTGEATFTRREGRWTTLPRRTRLRRPPPRGEDSDAGP